MPKEKLKELLEFVKSTDLQEVTLEKKGVTIRFVRPVAPAPATASTTTAVATGGAASTAGAVPEPPKMTIKSTMVGTFFRSDSKDRPPLVVEGTVVSAGQPVGAVEAMKIMKDVLAPSDCKIVKALVDNGHAVEYGQSLFEVEPLSPTPLPAGERAG